MIRRGKIMVDAEKAREAMDILASAMLRFHDGVSVAGLTPTECNDVLIDLNILKSRLAALGMIQPVATGAAT